jgi:hypothetical protein
MHTCASIWKPKIKPRKMSSNKYASDLIFVHETLLLDNGVPVHLLAARCGHDPATLLRSYAKRTRKADRLAAGVIGSISKVYSGTDSNWVQIHPMFAYRAYKTS